MSSGLKLLSHSQAMLTLIAIVVVSSACQPSPGGQTRPEATSAPLESSPKDLTIFAAASLAEAFTLLGERFKAGHPGTDLAFNFAGSQQLAQQLAQGAPADIFASANLDQMEAVVQEGLISPDSQQVFARNRLVVVAFPEANQGIQDLMDIAKPGTVLVLAGETVPAGKYSLEFLAKAGQYPAFGPAFEQAVLENVLSYEENVRAVLSKVILGEADAGIVYASDVAGVPGEQIRVLDIPDALNVQASYYLAPLLDSRQSTLADEFIAFILSAEGQQVLADYGFLPARQP